MHWRAIRPRRADPVVKGLVTFLNRRVVPLLTALSEQTDMSAIRAGMVSVVPLTIIGGLFMVLPYLPLPGWEGLVAPWLPLLQVPVTATFCPPVSSPGVSSSISASVNARPADGPPTPVVSIDTLNG